MRGKREGSIFDPVTQSGAYMRLRHKKKCESIMNAKCIHQTAIVCIFQTSPPPAPPGTRPPTDAIVAPRRAMLRRSLQTLSQ
ncbi:hypothetical protein EVAR_51669_1 [Eumeta japonica]|uniref:Uncharacterized protein n=1 Tax=Eumeta variegata TaxID=151549 RepID=A0A4C1YE02_EUMVA|nr:hypothetical protein EVAR_51669_1 [Eumeta japonica]